MIYILKNATGHKVHTVYFGDVPAGGTIETTNEARKDRFCRAGFVLTNTIDPSKPVRPSRKPKNDSLKHETPEKKEKPGNTLFNTSFIKEE